MTVDFKREHLKALNVMNTDVYSAVTAGEQVSRETEKMDKMTNVLLSLSKKKLTPLSWLLYQALGRAYGMVWKGTRGDSCIQKAVFGRVRRGDGEF